MENFDVGGGNFTFMEIGIGFMTHKLKILKLT
nr:hypothetical protein [Staphylococcus aureus]